MAVVSPLAGVDVKESVVLSPLLGALVLRLLQRSGSRFFRADEIAMTDG